eukprot:scaffold16631_cov80-Attheya_sp.AAC.1
MFVYTSVSLFLWKKTVRIYYLNHGSNVIHHEWRLISWSMQGSKLVFEVNVHKITSFKASKKGCLDKCSSLVEKDSVDLLLESWFNCDPPWIEAYKLVQHARLMVHKITSFKASKK